MRQLHELSALEQADAIRRDELRPIELVDHYLERVGRLSERVGAFITVTADAARAQALEMERRAPGTRGPLHGVPTAIKDLVRTAGVRTTFGSAMYADHVPPTDDDVVIRLRAAGTVSLGKTNTPEFGLPCYTEPQVAPPARTPWDLNRSAGGSSGGAAAAVAAGLVPFALGSDGGGSIRIPSSACGLFGIKPSRGRVSNGGPDITGLATQGPIARTVRDAAAMLDALAGPALGDASWAPQLSPGDTFLAWADRSPQRLRIGRHISPVVADAAIHEDCRVAWEEASRLLASLGHEVEDIPAPFGPEMVPLFDTVWAVMAASRPVDPARVGELTPLTAWYRARGGAMSGTHFVEALATLQRTARSAIAAQAGYDAILTPTLAQPPALVGWFTGGDDPQMDYERQCLFTPFAAVANVTGQPSVNVPLHWSADGLPIGVMLTGRPAGDGPLIALAAQIEAAHPWRERRPDCWA